MEIQILPFKIHGTETQNEIPPFNPGGCQFK